MHLLPVVFFTLLLSVSSTPPEPAGSAQPVLISRRVSGSLDPTWPPAQLLLMSASWCRLERVVFKQSPSLGAPRGAHPLRFLKGPHSNSSGGFSLKHSDLCFLTPCAFAFHFLCHMLGPAHFMVVRLVRCVILVTQARMFLQKTTSEDNDSGRLDAKPGQDILPCPLSGLNELSVEEEQTALWNLLISCPPITTVCLYTHHINQIYWPFENVFFPNLSFFSYLGQDIIIQEIFLTWVARFLFKCTANVKGAICKIISMWRNASFDVVISVLFYKNMFSMLTG